MSKRTFYACLGLTLFTFLWSPAVFGQSCRLALGDDGDSELWLEGTVGDSTVRAYFGTEPDGQLTGSFYDVNNWSPVLLEGIRGDDCKFRIFERRGERRDAVWEGEFKSRVFEGIKRKSDSAESAVIRLQRIPPMNCDGKGKWIRLNIPEFGISFEYPETWRITERSVTNIRLMCPDPRAMQFSDTGLSIESAGPPNELTQIGIFSKSRDKWLVGDAEIVGDCSTLVAFCTNAGVSRQPGVTVVHGSGSTRLYLSGGSYQGLGDEDAFLLLFKDGSLYVSSVFVKESTTERMVRSVRQVR
jgi:hypothetical protein